SKSASLRVGVAAWADNPKPLMDMPIAIDSALAFKIECAPGRELLIIGEILPSCRLRKTD
ncbi:MAG: hypothetical protein AB2695_14160, partial [Candidatus Thiodiazotropha endolucinida]